MKAVDQLDTEAMIRISERTKELMVARSSVDILKWINKNRDKVRLLGECTWLATREELER
jgi:hypothetical protein